MEQEAKGREPQEPRDVNGGGRRSLWGERKGRARKETGERGGGGGVREHFWGIFVPPPLDESGFARAHGVGALPLM